MTTISGRRRTNHRLGPVPRQARRAGCGLMRRGKRCIGSPLGQDPGWPSAVVLWSRGSMEPWHRGSQSAERALLGCCAQMIPLPLHPSYGGGGRKVPGRGLPNSARAVLLWSAAGATPSVRSCFMASIVDGSEIGVLLQSSHTAWTVAGFPADDLHAETQLKILTNDRGPWTESRLAKRSRLDPKFDP